MNYKLVAIDCDGTLVNDELKIPEKNIKVIRALREKGIKFVIVTGRNDIGAIDIIKELNITAPVIGCNGATTRDVVNDVLYNIYPIENEATKKIWEYFDSTKRPCQFFSLDKFYSNKYNADEVILSFLEKYIQIAGARMQTEKLDNVDELIAKNEKLIKCVYLTSDPDELIAVQKELLEIPNIQVFRSAKTCLDIVDVNVSKGNALLEYLKTQDIDPKEVVAIGDSENDYSMLSKVGYPVTMENGEHILKEIATFVTTSNNEGGVGFALERIFDL